MKMVPVKCIVVYFYSIMVAVQLSSLCLRCYANSSGVDGGRWWVKQKTVLNESNALFKFHDYHTVVIGFYTIIFLYTHTQ
jgi:hypothetical protein